MEQTVRLTTIKIKQFLKTYPKTGEVDSNIYTIAGGLILLGTLGLLGYEKWKKRMNRSLNY